MKVKKKHLTTQFGKKDENFCFQGSKQTPGGELPYEEYMGVCHELGSYFQEKIPKRVCQFFTKILKRAIISVRIPDRVSYFDDTNDKPKEDWIDWFLWPSLD